jgi:hypothetical protein
MPPTFGKMAYGNSFHSDAWMTIMPGPCYLIAELLKKVIFMDAYQKCIFAVKPVLERHYQSVLQNPWTR